MASLYFLTALLVVDALAVLLFLLLLLGILHLPVRMQIPPFALPVYLYLVIRGWCWILWRTNFVYLNCKIFFIWIYHHRLLVHWSGWNCGGNDDGLNGAEDEDQMTILSSVDIYDEFDDGPVLSICLGQWYHSQKTSQRPAPEDCGDFNKIPKLCWTQTAKYNVAAVATDMKGWASFELKIVLWMFKNKGSINGPRNSFTVTAN